MPSLRLLGLGSLLLALLPFRATAAPTQAPPVPLYPPKLQRDAPKPPFRARRRSGVKGLFGKNKGLIDLSRWPAEPTVEGPIDAARLATALGALCRRTPAEVLQRYARWMVDDGEEFGVDPLLLAAVVYRQSRCRVGVDSDFGVGLARIHPRMHADSVRDRTYHYHVLKGGEWQARSLPLPRFRFTRGNLERPEPNLYFAAALLAVHADQCPANDGVFGSVPHRHFVSHLAWGDRVRGAHAEDRVLLARRRLVEAYTGTRPPPLADWRGLSLHSPLDGAPRKVTSAPGASRAGGARVHQGIDFESTLGEPVRAVADGRVVVERVVHGHDRIEHVVAAGEIDEDDDRRAWRQRLGEEAFGKRAVGSAERAQDRGACRGRDRSHTQRAQEAAPAHRVAPVCAARVRVCHLVSSLNSSCTRARAASDA